MAQGFSVSWEAAAVVSVMLAHGSYDNEQGGRNNA
jgi:hypothetical protein